MYLEHSHFGRSPDLTYNIAECRLTGTIGGEHVSVYAVSGGRAGSKHADAVNWWLANNPFATHVHLPKNKSHPGGPLPMNRYRVVPHEQKQNWLRLIPLAKEPMHHRDGMAIHGRGERGSDGCIVPTDFHALLQICALVKKHKLVTGKDATLDVVAIGDVDYKLSVA